MESKFLAAWEAARKQAAALGVRIRPVTGDAMAFAHKVLCGHKESDGFWTLADMGRLELSLEALVVKKQFTSLFSDEEANNALNRLLSAGYRF